jgi:hypothetical protein
LCHRECACAREQGLKLVLVQRDRAGSLAGHQLAEWIGADGWPEPEVQELGEAALGRWALVLLDLDEPHLGACL